jgi:hypothetical protein
MTERFKTRRHAAVIWQAAALRRLFSKPFGEFEKDAPVGRILDFPECDNEP